MVEIKELNREVYSGKNFTVKYQTKGYLDIQSTTEVIIPGFSEPPVRTLRATIPENESHIFR